MPLCKISSKSKGIPLQSCKENSEISQRNNKCWVMVSFSLSHTFNWLFRFYFTRCKLDRKSTSGTCHLLGSSLISWHSKKQACVALSTVEAEYIAAGSCCAQILWLKQQLVDFGLQINKVPLMCDNTSAINLT